MNQSKLTIDFTSSDFQVVKDKLSHLVFGSFVGKRMPYSYPKDIVTNESYSSAFIIKF